MSHKQDRDPPKPKEPSFKNAKLHEQLARWKKTEPKKEKPPEPPRVVHRPPPPKPVRAQHEPDEQDDAFFRAAMEEVKPLPRTVGDWEPPPVIRTAQEVDEDAEAYAMLAELVATGEGLDYRHRRVLRGSRQGSRSQPAEEAAAG